MVNTTCVHTTKKIGDELTIGDVKITFMGIGSNGQHKISITSSEITAKLPIINSKSDRGIKKWLIPLTPYRCLMTSFFM